MLLINEKRPSLNIQTDSIPAKLFTPFADLLGEKDIHFREV